MQCKEFAAVLGDYLDRRIDESEALAIEQHAQLCNSCGLALRDHKLLTSMLPAALAEVAPPTDRMWSRIRAQLPIAAPAPQPSFTERLRALFLRGLVLAPVPALLLLLAALFWRQPAVQLAQPQNGGTGTSLHSNQEQRQAAELNQKTWDYVETGFKKYARNVKTRHTPR